MHKEEIIQIHRVLYLIAEYLKTKSLVKTLNEYEAFMIRPFHINRSKDEHLTAIFVLSREILENIIENDGISNKREILITINAINNLISKKFRPTFVESDRRAKKESLSVIQNRNS